MLINLTQKAIKETRLEKVLTDREEIAKINPDENHVWYCTDLEIYSDASALLLVHKLTWFSIPIVVRNLHPEDLPWIIRDNLLKTLMHYEVPSEQIDSFMRASQEMRFVKGDNYKRLIGIMNSMKGSVQHMIDYAHEHRSIENWGQIMIENNSMLFGAPDYVFPIEQFVQRYGGKKLGMERFKIS